MTTKYTVSVHQGPRASRGHNLRDANAIKNQLHIQPGGLYEVWIDEEPSAAYSRIFDQVLKEYNILQKKRKKSPITNYYRKVCKDGKLNAVYEVIVTIGNCKERVDDRTGWDILKEYVDGWHERNPNLQLIGAYYHADERDPETGLLGAPHLHLDYIPVAYHCMRGLETQTSQSQAFKQMGIESFGAKRTAQMEWQERERRALKKICRAYGLEVASPKQEKRQHVETEVYKMVKKAEEKVNALNAEADQISLETSVLLAEKEEAEDEIADIYATLDRFEAAELSKEKLDEIQEKSKGQKIEVDTSSYLSLKLTAAESIETKERQKKAELKQRDAEERKCKAEERQQKAEKDFDTLNRCFLAAMDVIKYSDLELFKKALAAAQEIAEEASYSRKEMDEIR